MISGGFLLVVIGVIIWLNKMGIWDWAWKRDWPVILILVGFMSIISHLEGRGKFRIMYKKKKHEKEIEE